MSSELKVETADDAEWMCCSGRHRPACIKYCVQICFGAFVLIFCAVQIGLGHNDSIYWSLLSSTLAYFLPSPSMDETRGSN